MQRKKQHLKFKNVHLCLKKGRKFGENEKVGNYKISAQSNKLVDYYEDI